MSDQAPNVEPGAKVRLTYNKKTKRIEGTARITITQEQADMIDRRIRAGYHDIAGENRLGYPSYKITPWEDRAAYHEYVVRVLNDMVQP